MALEMRVEEITPERAQELLGKNNHNRRLSQHRVSTLAREMAENHWLLNGESIKINGDGSLKDGQHRLAAVIESGITIKSVVVSGIGDAEQETIDTGWRRSMSDVLDLRGESDTAALAGALLLCWSIENKVSQRGGKPNKVGSPSGYPTHAELSDYLDANPNIRLSLPIGRQANASEVRFPQSKAAGMHYLMTQKDAEQADHFWEMLSGGTGLTAQHPVQVLRRQLLRDLTGAGDSRRRMHASVRNAITIKAWNAYRIGKTPSVVFSWRATGPQAEKFPEIK